MTNLLAGRHRLQGLVLLTLVALVLGFVVVWSLVEAPTSGRTGPGATSTPSTAPAPLSPGPTAPSPSGTPSARPLPDGVSTARPKDPKATGPVKQVSRDGSEPEPSIETTSDEQSFGEPVEYSDGVRVSVTNIAHGTMSGHGPGVYPGRSTTNFDLTLTNDTEAALELGVVVVTVTYGSRARVAHHIYDETSVDFGGIVKPGTSTKGMYGFSIPKNALADVTMTVDIDGEHHLAVFHGSVKG